MIEDITYLIENSEKDSQIVYIDSTLRNKLFYPKSNEYMIEFDQPFKLVYGFDILDAAIPVTMYNVDVLNNIMNYSIVSINTSALTPIDPEQYFNEIITCNTFIITFDKDVVNYNVIGSETQLNNYINITISNPDDNYTMYVRHLINTSQIIKRAQQIDTEFYFFTFNHTDYCINLINQDLINIIILNEYSLYLTTDGSFTINLIYFTNKKIDKITYNSIINSGSFIINITNTILILPIGNYDVLTIMNDINDIVNPIVEVTSTTPIPKKEGKLYFSSTSLIFINGAKGNLIKSLGFDTYPAATATPITYKGWTIGNNYLVFGAVYDPILLAYKIVSPGLISLLGERFTILRIKEIEDHLFGSFSYMKMTPGIGMFKMASPFGGITNLRFDYTTVIKKAFHPIGKLSKLTIRFETSVGTLYDFKGVNHQLMVNIKFYVPTSTLKFTRSILNPNYDPNVMKYMAKNRTIECKEDSDDEQEFNENEYYEEYKKELDKYDYSSSDDEKTDNGTDTDTNNNGTNNSKNDNNGTNNSTNTNNNNGGDGPDEDNDDSEEDTESYIKKQQSLFR